MQHPTCICYTSSMPAPRRDRMSEQATWTCTQPTHLPPPDPHPYAPPPIARLPARDPCPTTTSRTSLPCAPCRPSLPAGYAVQHPCHPPPFHARLTLTGPLQPAHHLPGLPPFPFAPSPPFLSAHMLHPAPLPFRPSPRPSPPPPPARPHTRAALGHMVYLLPHYNIQPTQ